MAKLIVDASVGVKWVIDEEQSADAEALIALECELVVPDLFTIEAANVFWLKTRKKEQAITPVEAAQCFTNLRELMTLRGVRTVRSALIQGSALRIALEAGRSVYDSLYIALAIAESCTVVTADKRLVNGLRDTPYEGLAVLLGA